ncbi:MAG: diacylglycerol kinase family lipid kinase [Saprospiraceae bacterium]|nr:diacylglycerol kinase family lipid kinase [Saprospiraceae bacterium]
MDKNSIWYIIVNPKAGGGKAIRKWKQLKVQLSSKGWPYEVFFTKGKSHARHLTIQAAELGHRQVIAVGGDGTNNEVINGIMEVRKRENVILHYALYPAGNGNDFARHFKFPSQAYRWIKAVESASVKRQDLGMVEYQKNGVTIGRYFANAAGVGYDAHVIHAMTDHKRKTRHKSFLVSALQELVRFIPQGTTVRSEEQNYTGKIYLIVAGVCRFAGGGMQLTPHAIANDGLLAITMVQEVPIWKIILNLPKLYTGKIHNLKEVLQWQTSSLLIEPFDGHSLLLEVDGEIIGGAPCRIVTVPDALHLLCPKIKK